MMKVGVKMLRDSARLPTRATTGSAGWDVYAAIQDPITVMVGCRELIPTGLAFEIPDGYEVQVRPRSGLALKSGITVLNSPGTIDSDYRLEVGIVLINHGASEFVVRPSDRIAQLVVAPVLESEFVIVDDVSETTERTGGFGSTGMK